MVNGGAFFFAGQGAQYVGMGRDLYEQFPEAKRIYDSADRLLGFSITTLSFEGPEDALVQTSKSQPAIFTLSGAVLEVLRSRCETLKPSAVCGLSLGEFNALEAAQVFSFEDGLRMVQKRGRLMEEAGLKFPGTMASVIGMDRAALEAVCTEAGCQVANLNSEDQVVISGSNTSVEHASEMARTRGARRVIPLKVSGAFHSNLMQEAADQLRAELAGYSFRRPQIPFYANVSAQEESDPQHIRDLLGDQVTHPVRWLETINKIYNQGIRSAFEIGPGTVLKGLVRKIKPDFEVKSLGTAEQVKKLLNL